MSPNGLSGYLECLKYVVKTAFNNGWIPRNPFALYRYTPPQVERGCLAEEELQRLMPLRLYRPCTDRFRENGLSVPSAGSETGTARGADHDSGVSEWLPHGFGRLLVGISDAELLVGEEFGEARDLFQTQQLVAVHADMAHDPLV